MTETPIELLEDVPEPSMETGPSMRPAPSELSSRLQPLPGKRDPAGRDSLLKRVHRPFYRISKFQYDNIIKMAKGGDVLLFEGLQQVVAGEADGGYALMPVHKPL